MEIQHQLILSAGFVYFGLILVQSHDQTTYQVTPSKVDGKGKIQKNFQNLFNAIVKNDSGRSEIHSEVLNQEVIRERETFDTMKEELQMARVRNAYKKRKFYNGRSNAHENVIAIKRETDGNNPSSSTNPLADPEDSLIEEKDSSSLQLDDSKEPPNDSSSALKSDDYSGVEESDIDSSELSLEEPSAEESTTDFDFSLTEETPKQTSKKDSASLLKEVYGNADQFLKNLDKVADVANSKLTDWSQRINTYRNLLFGTGTPNNNNNGYGGNDWQYGGGGSFGNQFNNGGGVSIKSAYNTIKPFFMEIKAVLSKVFEFTSKLASQLPVKPPSLPRRPRPGAVAPHPERSEPLKSGRLKTQPKGRKRRNRSRKVRVSAAAGARRGRKTTATSETPDTVAEPVYAGALSYPNAPNTIDYQNY